MIFNNKVLDWCMDLEDLCQPYFGTQGFNENCQYHKQKKNY